MKAPILIAVFFIIGLLAAAQSDFAISGTITGKHNDRIYLFFENDVEHKDSISSIIKKGKFKFTVNAPQPILCRIHFSSNSNIQEFYADGPRTELTLSSKLIQDASGVRTEFSIKEITGSTLEDDKRAFYAYLEKNAKPSSEYTTADVAYPYLRNYISENPKSKMGAFLAAGRIYMLGDSFMLMGEPPFNYTWTKRLSSMLDSSVMNGFEGQNLRLLLGHLAKSANRDTGKMFLDVMLRDTLGKEVSTTALRGKYVLVDFWASWCGPCRMLNPDLKKLLSQYQGKGFEIMGIALESDIDAWKKAITKDDLPWLQLLDEKAFKGVLAKNYNIIGIPTKVLLDPTGKVIAFNPSLFDLEKFLGALD
jgi:thiol-disulfide isomerase/thioredoxin